MSVGRSLSIARNDLRIMRRDSFPIVILVVMPLVGMVFMKSAFQPTLVAEGLRSPNGAEQAVPGMSVMFGFLLVSFIGYGFFREHAWNTWDRLRASPATAVEIMLGKATGSLALALLQFILVFGLGSLLMGLTVRGSWLEIIAVGCAYALFVVSAGLAIAALCRTVMQSNTIAYLGMVLLACLGGALIPRSLLPPWAEAVSPAVPSYWAMHGYRDAILGHGSAIPSVLILLGFSFVLGLVAILRMRFDETKIGFA